MPFKLVEFLERFMNGAFLITLTQYEKTGISGKYLFRWKPKIQIPLSKLEIVHIFHAISLLVFGERYLRHFQQLNFI